MKPYGSQLGEDAEGQWDHHSEDHRRAHMPKRRSEHGVLVEQSRPVNQHSA